MFALQAGKNNAQYPANVFTFAPVTALHTKPYKISSLAISGKRLLAASGTRYDSGPVLNYQAQTVVA